MSAFSPIDSTNLQEMSKWLDPSCRDRFTDKTYQGYARFLANFQTVRPALRLTQEQQSLIQRVEQQFETFQMERLEEAQKWIHCYLDPAAAGNVRQQFEEQIEPRMAAIFSDTQNPELHATERVRRLSNSVSDLYWEQLWTPKRNQAIKTAIGAVSVIASIATRSPWPVATAGAVYWLVSK